MLNNICFVCRNLRATNSPAGLNFSFLYFFTFSLVSNRFQKTSFSRAKANIFIDKQSGKDFNRPQYRKLIKKMKQGDLLYIKSIDRLGRNYTEILEQWAMITKEKKVNIVVIDMPLLDTRDKGQDLLGVFIADLVLQILSYVAETERDFIKKRQAEGIAAAKARGVQFGAKKKELPEEFESMKLLWENGEITVREAGKRLNVSASTFYRRCVEVRVN